MVCFLVKQINTNLASCLLTQQQHPQTLKSLIHLLSLRTRQTSTDAASRRETKACFCPEKRVYVFNILQLVCSVLSISWLIFHKRWVSAAAYYLLCNCSSPYFSLCQQSSSSACWGRRGGTLALPCTAAVTVEEKYLYLSDWCLIHQFKTAALVTPSWPCRFPGLVTPH